MDIIIADIHSFFKQPKRSKAVQLQAQRAVPRGMLEIIYSFDAVHVEEKRS